MSTKNGYDATGRGKWETDSPERDSNGFVEFDQPHLDGVETIVRIPHKQTNNVYVAVETSSEIDWEIRPVRADDTICGDAIASGTTDSSHDGEIFDDVIGAEAIALHMNDDPDHVEVITKR